MKCGIVIYDITQDQSQIKEAQWALKSIVQRLENVQQVSPKAFKRSDEVRYFILISTIMTWANTKPLNPDEPDLPFTEEDYRKRKPHPNFKNHIQCEKDVVITKKKIKLKDKLKTLVICCGVTYGDEEGPLHHLFKMAWLNAPFLPIFGKGNNRIPLLHVRDMTNVILDVLQNWPQLQYIVAMEQEPTSQAAIVKTKEIDEETTLKEKGEVEQAMEDMDEEEEDLLEDRTAKLEEQQELLDEIQRNRQRANGYLDDDLVNRLFQRKLRSKECQNQGYVIDGYPKTLEQAQMLFTGERADELEEEMEEEAEMEPVTTILPELVVSLEASDDFLKERIIQQPEKNIQDTHYTEEHMIRRLKEYRKRNTDENTPLQFFDEIEIHPLIIDIEEDDCPDMFPTVYQCLERIGPPRNYGLSAEEARNARKRAEVEALEAETAAKLQEKKEYLELKRLREQKMEEWTNLMEKLTEEQEEKLCLASLPLRNYLMKYVLPTLTQGLIEVANLRPDDPVDFLAEYLFRENPEGKMFEPEHTNAMASILNMIDKFNTFLLPEEEVSSQVLQLLKRKSPTEEIESTDSDVCTAQKTYVTPCYTCDDDTCVDEETSELTEPDEED
ncbi:adenylate kinase 7-like [Apis laboriosa]|uniref:adenylate kinase 7-like n=1 Tax=Apis laboriosa TaxID=183418 RepID=UPI001CC3F50B|nr:adenylate kinase 7-like [Apis laboriosa]